jgi:predicted nucleotidyltransferase
MTDLNLSVLNKIFEESGDILFAYLFGSCARGDAFPSSDIDLAVFLTHKKISLDQKLDLHSRLSRALKTGSLDLTVLNEIKNLMLLEEIVRYGRVVCDKNPSRRETFESGILHDAIDFKYQRQLFAGV